MATVASWYHCSVKPVSRSAGRSVVAAAAYRLGERLHDERYDTLHDYTRRSGVENAFTMAPGDAPDWALDPERLWNEAEKAETRKNSTLGREIELALPAFLTPEERRDIVQRFAEELIDRYGVAVSAAIHEPGKGDERNFHAHILFTTREMTAEGLGKKTRILDDRSTGPQEVLKLRELAADLINAQLEAVNADTRVDHRSFKDRGIEQEPTTHLGPIAANMERRGEPSDRGEVNRQAGWINTLIVERFALEGMIAKLKKRRQRRLSSPPLDRDDALERMREDAAPLTEIVLTAEPEREMETDGLSWWQRAAVRVQEKARDFALSLGEKFGQYWQSRQKDREPDDDRGLDL
jgi:hypothetical protein